VRALPVSYHFRRLHRRVIKVVAQADHCCYEPACQVRFAAMRRAAAALENAEVVGSMEALLLRRGGSSINLGLLANTRARPTSPDAYAQLLVLTREHQVPCGILSCSARSRDERKRRRDGARKIIKDPQQRLGWGKIYVYVSATGDTTQCLRQKMTRNLSLAVAANEGRVRLTDARQDE